MKIMNMDQTMTSRERKDDILDTRSVLEYLDYRQFLQEFYEKRKTDTSFFSYRYFAGRLEIDPGQLVKVMQGKLHLPSRVIPALARLCRFDDRELRYFEELMRFSRAKSHEDIAMGFARLMTVKGVDAKTLTDEHSEYYLRWYHTAIRGLVGIQDFTGDYEQLAKQCTPKISVDEARESVELLQKLGMIIEDNGHWKIAEHHVTAGSEIPVKILREYQAEAIRLSQRALQEVVPAERDISTLSIAVAEKDMEQVRSWILELRRKLQTLSQSCDQPDRIYQFNVQYYPMGKL